jgi:hypothetical protein
MKLKHILIIGILFALAILSQTVDAAFSGPTNNFQSYQPTFDRLYSSGGDFVNSADMWPVLGRMENDQCNATSDFIIGIPPGGCTPGVVRSDLLEEQNVPVFCQLYAIKVNPLIKVSSIRSISFPGKKPEGVSSIVFHPARAAVKSYTTLLGDPTLNNIGYVVIILKREKIEDNMEEWISGNLSATIRYDAEEAYGTGASEYYLPAISDGDWNTDYAANSFWSGRGFLRLADSGEGTAKIEILSSKDKVVKTFNLKEGETSPLTYLPGYYCRAGLKIKLDGIVAPEDKVLVNIDGDEFWLREGDRFLNKKCRIGKLEVDANNAGNLTVSCNGNKRIDLRLKKDTDFELTDGGLDSDDAEEYFVDANKTATDLVEIYRSAEKENGDTFGEEALYEQIVLSGRVGKWATQAALMELFIDKYPSSKIVEDVRIKRQRLNGTDFSESYTSVYVNDRFHTIGVVDFESVTKNVATVDLRVGTQSSNGKKVGDSLPVPDGKFNITKIIPGKVTVQFKSEKEGVKSKTYTILMDDSELIGGTDVYIRDVNVEEVAHVSIIPEVKRTKTEADFTFKIGIEKRAIELSPEKTRMMLENLDEAIEKWENIVERLGNVVKGLKGACFATSTFLMLKNMATGFSGEAAARQRVMDKFKATCDTHYGTKTRTQCYNDLSPQIEGNVTAMTTALKAVNTKMEAAQEGNTGNSGGLFGGTGITSQDKYIEDLRTQVNEGPITVGLGGGKTQEISKEDLTSVSQIQAVLLHQELDGQGVLGDGQSQLEQSLRNTALRVQQEEANNVAAVDLKDEWGRDIDSGDIITLTNKDTRYFKWSGKVAKDYDLNHIGGENDKTQIVKTASGEKYLAVLGTQTKGGKTDGGISGIDKVYQWENDAWVKKDKPSEMNNVVFTSAGAAGDCKYPWPSSKATVSYYEAGNNKGLPAIVPFYLEEGWYVMVPNSGGTFLDDSPQGYTASADVKYFKICNIGPDRLMQNGKGDDLCQSFDVNTIGSVKNFIPCPDKSSDEVQKLYGCAREAIRQASSQAGNSDIRINSGCGEQSVMKKGQPMSQVGGFECQDFMSPDDCKLMFNVCDPVICPPSRCDLGGKMPVADVIQTGIVGSLVLCLPNAAEGVLFPICLSGIHAGLDAYLSILRSEQDCLEKSLETGEHVGICDEITSIYKCEFFWRQLSPVMDQLIPSVVQGLISPGQRVRGGGEYALVQQSWNSMQQSISYFKDVYAQNAFKAFNIRSTEEVGSQVCKAFVGTSVPGGADMIDSLLEPESPHQFYAQFSEIKFTEATVPATAQYKVYYHIYAGNDQGSQYRVYLKNPPATSYYQSNPTIQVKSGYIAAGSAADETVDFIAPEGYKELCVVINAQEECGFKQVTTDFGLNYVQNKYVQDQAEKENIQSEKECISGSPSALSMVNLNLQAGAEETAMPEIAMRGIVRVCATTNPAAGVDVGGKIQCTPGSDPDNRDGCGTGYSCNAVTKVCSYARDGVVYNESSGTRWKDVGTCGEGLTCWLDTNSVKSDLEAIEAIEGTTISVLDERRGLIDTGVLNLEQVQERLASARLKIKGLSSAELKVPGEKVKEILALLDSVIGTLQEDGYDEDAPGAGTNVDRAEAMALKASVFRMIVMELTQGLIIQPAHVAVSKEISGVGTVATEESLRECETENDPICDFGYCDVEAGVCKDYVVEETVRIGDVDDGYKVYVNGEPNGYYFTTGDKVSFVLFEQVGNNNPQRVAGYRSVEGVFTFTKFLQEGYDESDISFLEGKTIIYDSSTDSFNVGGSAISGGDGVVEEIVESTTVEEGEIIQIDKQGSQYFIYDELTKTDYYLTEYKTGEVMNAYLKKVVDLGFDDQISYYSMDSGWSESEKVPEFLKNVKIVWDGETFIVQTL